MYKFILVLIIVAELFAGGCGTIIHGTRQDLSIITSPPGIVARVGTQSCITPCTLNISRRADFIYLAWDSDERLYGLGKNANVFTFYIGNILWGIIPGMIFDSLSGGKYSIEPINVIKPVQEKEKDEVKSQLNF